MSLMIQMTREQLHWVRLKGVTVRRGKRGEVMDVMIIVVQGRIGDREMGQFNNDSESELQRGNGSRT